MTNKGYFLHWQCILVGIDFILKTWGIIKKTRSYLGFNQRSHLGISKVVSQKLFLFSLPLKLLWIPSFVCFCFYFLVVLDLVFSWKCRPLGIGVGLLFFPPFICIYFSFLQKLSPVLFVFLTATLLRW